MRRPFIGLASQLLITLAVVFGVFVLTLAWTVHTVRVQVDELLNQRLEALDDWSEGADRAVARQVERDHEVMARLLAEALARDLGRAPRLVELTSGPEGAPPDQVLPLILGSEPLGVHVFEVRGQSPVRRLTPGPPLRRGASLVVPMGEETGDDWTVGRWWSGEGLPPDLPPSLVYVGREDRRSRLVVAFERDALAERLLRRPGSGDGVRLLDESGATLLSVGREPAGGRGAQVLATAEVPGTPWRLSLLGSPHTHSGPETVTELDLAGPLNEAKTRVFATVGVVFLLCLGVVGLLLHYRLTVPARRLREDIRIVTRGNLDHPIDVEHAAELGTLAQQFSELTAQLVVTRGRLREYNRTLERSVQERTAELNTRNTELSRAYQEKERAYLELQTTQTQMLHQERMATLGQLLAGIAHEINNPVNFMVNAIRPLEDNVRRIQGVLQLLIEQYGDVLGPVAGRVGSGVPDLDQAMADIQQSIRLIRTGADRTSAIISNLRNFSRTQQEELSLVDLSSCLDVTLSLLAHETKGRIEVSREYVDVPQVECCHGEINQVFMNLLSNACQAIVGSGRLWLRIDPVEEGVRVRIQDSGGGIAPETLPHIFEPFFTTKEAGVGTGLGLAITSNIVAKHGGRIEVASVPGETTEFEVLLPLRQGAAPAAWSGLTTAPEVDPDRW